MKKFLVLYHSSVSAAEQMAKTTPEQAKAGMDAWTGWAKTAGSALVDLGSPLTHAMSAPSKSATPGSHVGGFSILQAESSAALGELLKNHPHLMMSGNSIDVHEFLPMPGL